MTRVMLNRRLVGVRGGMMVVPRAPREPADRRLELDLFEPRSAEPSSPLPPAAPLLLTMLALLPPFPLAAAVVSLLVWPGADLIAGAYATDAALIEMVRAALVLACLFFIADALQVVGAQALRACGDIRLSTAVQVASYAAVMLPLGWALALPFGLGLSGIVWAVIAASLMSAALLLTRFAAVARG